MAKNGANPDVPMSDNAATPGAGGVKRPWMSPTGETPPSKSTNVDVTEVLDMLNDPRIKAVAKRITDDMDARFKVHVDSLGARINDIEARLNAKYDTLQTRVVTLESKVKSLESKVELLQAEMDKSEQYSRRNSLRIWTNDPEQAGEDTDKIVLACAEKLGVNLNLEEIDRSHRVGRVGGNKPRAIIVKMATYRSRQKLYRNRRRDRGIFISEDLTKKRSNLMYNARRLKRGKAIKSCYTRDGRVYIREFNPWGTDRDEEGHEVEIRSIKDLDKYWDKVSHQNNVSTEPPTTI